MSLSLYCHPDSYCGAVDDILVHLSLSASGHLILKYIIKGDIDGLNLPHHAKPEREDELWAETCMEVFLQPKGGQSYTEMNFSPSSKWAIYKFKNHRKKLPDPEIASPPVIRTHLENASLTLFADIDLSQFSELSRDITLNIGLSAVIEELSGRKSFWALAHSTDEPDFHNSDCFIHQLRAAGAA